MSNRSETNSTFDLRGFASGLVIGGLAGTAIALLNAPQSGRKTRAQIRQKTLELRDQAADQIDDAWQQAEDTVRRARLKTRQVKRNAEATVRDLKYRGQALVEDQKDRVGSALEALQPVNGRD